jgi:hypothetical protein
MSDTPETDNLARGNHVVPTEFAEQLERERDEAREEIEMLGIRYAAAEMHHETNMQEVTEQRDRWEAWQAALQSIPPNKQ